MDIFTDTKFCQVHTPVPLGVDRKRFLHLISDIRNRKDEYAAWLSSLTLASLSGADEKRDGSARSIAASLMGDPVARKNTEQEERIWQARLTLAIAEILDGEEEETARALASLDESERDLFARLQGEEEIHRENLLEDLTELKKRLHQPRRERTLRRIMAWETLLRADDHPVCPLWLTTRSDAADILFENYEEQTGTAPLPLFSTELPAITGNSAKDSLEKTAAHSLDAAPLLEEAGAGFRAILEGKKNGAPPSFQ